MSSAFGTEIHRYNVNGELHYANVTAPVIPSALSGIIAGVRGLHDFRPRAQGIRRKTGPRPAYNSSAFGPLVAPGDIAAIYDIKALYDAGIDGSGQKLAVMGQTDLYLADITDFRTGFGLSAISCATDSSGVITSCDDPHFSYVLNGADPQLSTNGDISEADLDLEWAGAVARGAQIIYVNSTDVFTSYYYADRQQCRPSDQFELWALRVRRQFRPVFLRTTLGRRKRAPEGKFHGNHVCEFHWRHRSSRVRLRRHLGYDHRHKPRYTRSGRELSR